MTRAAATGAAALAGLLAVAACAAPAPEPAGPFRDARGVAADARGRLYVADAGARAVVVLSADGLPLARLGGAGADALAEPAAVDPTNGLAVFVADASAGRVLRYTPEGALAEAVPVPEALAPGPRPREDARRGRPVAVAADAAGALYVASRGAVLRLGPGGAVERVVGGAGEGAQPVGLALGARGDLLVADRGRGAVRVFDAFGAPVREVPAAAVGELVGVARTADGRAVAVGSLGVQVEGEALRPAAGLRGAAVASGRIVGVTRTALVDLGPVE